MKLRWAFLGCASVALVAGACASKVGSGQNAVAAVGSSTAGTGGSAAASTGSQGGAMAASTGTMSTSESSSSGGAKCTKEVGPFPPDPADEPNTIFCPFSSNPPAKTLKCANQTAMAPQHCCEPAMAGPLSTCVASAMACPAGDTDWVCEDPTDCGANMFCCSNHGAKFNLPNPPMVNGMVCSPYGSSFHTTTCSMTACGADQLTICTSDGQCNGKKCSPMATKGNHIGVCQ